MNMISTLLRRFFAKPAQVQTQPLSYQPLTWDSRCLYAVGDLHGSADLLRRIESAILKDMDGNSAQMVLLGDMIDRGPNSADIMDHLLRRPPAGLTRQTILGNHEVMFLQFCANPAATSSWLDFGGRETLASYGIDPAFFAGLRQKQQRQQIDANIPSQHRAFLADLPAVLSWGPYVFAHAGLNFSFPLTAQTADTLFWQRSPTLPHTVPQGQVLVHGHFPTDMPDLTSSVINMDVGAYTNNRGCILRLDPSGNKKLIEV